MKNIILTGASSGLGKAIGELCLKRNINVVALCRKKPDYACDYIYTDLTDEESILNACNVIKEQYNEFDALINCAGTISLQSIDKLTFKEMEDVYRVNSIAPTFIISNLLPLIIENKADILNVASIMGTMYDIERNSITYSASKWAFRGASINLENELRDTPCRIITVNPGGMNTNLFKSYDENIDDFAKDWMKPEDIADVILYTLSLPKQVEITEITITRKNI